MIAITLVANIALCAGSLVWGYALAGFDAWARWILLAGAVWLVALWQRWLWASSVGLLGSVFLGGIGLMLGLSAGWMLAGALFGLVAWDLTEFRRRLLLAYFDDDLGGLERRHLLRLSLLTLAALGLASLAMRLRLPLSFEWMLLLGLASALALAHFFRWLRSSG